MIFIKKILNTYKYKIARYIERYPSIIIFFLNHIRFLNFLLPHDKDYLAMKLICKKTFDNEIIDIGASVGSSILSFRKMGFENKIFSFEPNKYLTDNYLSKIKKKDKYLEIYNYGIGDTNSNKDFYVPYYKNISLHMFSSFKESIVRESLSLTYPHLINEFKIKKFNLEIKKLDDINLFSNLHFVKIDAEGSELEIINGMIKLIQKFKPFILIEFNENNFEDLCICLKEYHPYKYNIKTNSLNKIPNYILKNSDIDRINLDNLLSTRNIYFIPTNKN